METMILMHRYTTHVIAKCISTSLLQDIRLDPSDPNEEDDGCLDDLLKSPEECHWRYL